MGVKSFKPYTPSRRNMTVSDPYDITHKGRNKPEKKLTSGLTSPAAEVAADGSRYVLKGAVISDVIA